MISLKGKTAKIIIKAGICLFFLIVMHLIVSMTVLKRVNERRVVFQKVQKELALLQQLTHTYPDPEKKLEELEQKREEFRARADAKNELPRIIQQLTQKSSELNIEIISIKEIEKPPFKEEELPDGVSKAYLEVVLKAPYKTIGEYLKELASLPVVCTVEGLSLRKFSDARKGLREKETTDSEGKVIATFIISSYTVWKI